MASFILPIISGLAGLFGGGQQSKTTTNQSGQQFGSTTGSSYGSTNPNLSPLQQALSQAFGTGAQNLYNSAADLSGYTSSGLQRIGQQGSINNKAISNILAARGLSFSPAGQTALTQNTINTGNQMQQFQQQIPLLQRQLQQQSLGGLESAFGALPTGTTSTGTTSGTTAGNFNESGTSTTSGNPLAGLFGGLGAGFAGPSGFGGSNLSSLLRMFGYQPQVLPGTVPQAYPGSTLGPY